MGNGPHDHHHSGDHSHSHAEEIRNSTDGRQALDRLSRISQKKQEEETARSLELGLEAASSVVDRSISLFSRGHQPAFAGINTFMKVP